MVAANETKPTDPTLAAQTGPDPVVGVGMVIVGILIMGIGGAATAHYLFNLGSVIAVLGAVLFVGFVALSTYRQRVANAAANGAQQSATNPK